MLIVLGSAWDIGKTAIVCALVLVLGLLLSPLIILGAPVAIFATCLEWAKEEL